MKWSVSVIYRSAINWLADNRPKTTQHHSHTHARTRSLTVNPHSNQLNRNQGMHFASGIVTIIPTTAAYNNDINNSIDIIIIISLQLSQYHFHCDLAINGGHDNE